MAAKRLCNALLAGRTGAPLPLPKKLRFPASAPYSRCAALHCPTPGSTDSSNGWTFSVCDTAVRLCRVGLVLRHRAAPLWIVWFYASSRGYSRRRIMHDATARGSPTPRLYSNLCTGLDYTVTVALFACTPHCLLCRVLSPAVARGG